MLGCGLRPLTSARIKTAAEVEKAEMFCDHVMSIEVFKRQLGEVSHKTWIPPMLEARALLLLKDRSWT